jgi:hypothetical protein
MIPVTSPRVTSSLPESYSSILPDEIITCISSHLLSAIHTKRYAEACKIGIEFMATPNPGSVGNKRMQLLKLECLLEDRLCWFKIALRIVRSPWKDLASFAGTCKRFHRIVRSEIYSDRAIRKKIILAEDRICTFRFLLATGKTTAARIASKIKDLQPFVFVICGTEFSIEWPSYRFKKC